MLTVKFQALTPHLGGRRVSPLSLLRSGVTVVFSLRTMPALGTLILLLTLLSSAGFALRFSVLQSIGFAGALVSFTAGVLRADCFADTERQCRALRATCVTTLVHRAVCSAQSLAVLSLFAMKRHETLACLG